MNVNANGTDRAPVVSRRAVVRRSPVGQMSRATERRLVLAEIRYLVEMLGGIILTQRREIAQLRQRESCRTEIVLAELLKRERDENGL